MINKSGTVWGTSCWLGNYLKETKRKKQVNKLFGLFAGCVFKYVDIEVAKKIYLRVRVE